MCELFPERCGLANWKCDYLKSCVFLFFWEWSKSFSSACVYVCVCTRAHMAKINMIMSGYVSVGFQNTDSCPLSVAVCVCVGECTCVAMLGVCLCQVYEFAVKEMLILRVPLEDGGISPQKKKRKHRQDVHTPSTFSCLIDLHCSYKHTKIQNTNNRVQQCFCFF